MSSPFRKRALVVLCLALACSGAGASDNARVLRVCADPDNLPFSREDGSGFENRIASLLAADLNATLTYSWLPQRRGFVRKTIGEGSCDVWMGVPADFERLATTRPYYRSSYMFVSREETRPIIRSFDDPRLKTIPVGVQLIGNDLAATPAGHALALNGAARNVIGFTVYGEHPSAQRMIEALEARKIDAALIWGPQAGYFASRSRTRMGLVPARAPASLTAVPFEFSISVGVRRGERELLRDLDSALERRRIDIDTLLAEYAVPRADLASEAR
jgi:mxaJ protein